LKEDIRMSSKSKISPEPSPIKGNTMEITQTMEGGFNLFNL